MAFGVEVVFFLCLGQCPFGVLDGVFWCLGWCIFVWDGVFCLGWCILVKPNILFRRCAPVSVNREEQVLELPG